MKKLAAFAGASCLVAACASFGTTAAPPAPAEDAGASETGAPAAPCLFCDSFDDAATFSSAWTTEAHGGGTVAVEDGAVVAAIPITDASARAEAFAWTELDVPAGAALRFVVDVRVEATSNKGAMLANLKIRNGNDVVQLYLFDRAGGQPITAISLDHGLDDGGFGPTTNYYTAPQSLAEQRVFRLTIDIDARTGGAPTVTTSLLDVAGGTTSTLVDHLATDWGFAPSHLRLEIGAEDVNLPTASPWRVTLDNVRIATL